MDRPDAAALIQQITDASEARCVALSGCEGRTLLHRALRAGACGYVAKTAGTSDLARAIREVAAGRRYVSPSLSHHLVDALQNGLGDGDAGSAAFDLTPREREVLVGIANGASCPELAVEARHRAANRGAPSREPDVEARHPQDGPAGAVCRARGTHRGLIA